MTCRGRVTPSHNNVPQFSSRFQEKYLIGSKASRSRIFHPQNLFLTVCELVTGTNNNGYSTAILNALSKLYEVAELPVKSALTQMRSRISFRFFEDQFIELNKKIDRQRKTWEGLYLYAIDGIQLTLPYSRDIVDGGYSGRKVSKYRESYMPKMFLTAALDVINGVVKDVREYPLLDEVRDAFEMVSNFEDNSLTIYDRLYASRKLLHLHNAHHSFFLFRLRGSVMQEMRAIFTSKRGRITVEIDGITVHLIKIKNPKTGEWAYFASNLPLRLVKEKTINNLYRLRWEVENSFRDFTQTIKLEQWHSKSINGIRQELFTALWLYNFAKAKILSKFDPAKECMQDEYSKPNFKFIFGWMTSRLFEIFKGVRGVLKDLVELIHRSLETRRRHSRNYKREIKSPASPYPYNNTRWDGPN
jgi:hypothetical protein